MKLTLYVILSKVYLLLYRILLRYRLLRLLHIFHKIGIAVRFVIFDDHWSTLTGHTPSAGTLYQEGTPTTLPGWLIDELTHIGTSVDSTLRVSPQSIKSLKPTFFPYRPDSGLMIKRLLSLCSSNEYDFCFVLPWLIRGGADKGAISIIDAVSRKFSNVLVVFTEPRESEWRHKLPKHIDIMDIGLDLRSLNDSAQVVFLSRFFIQANIKRLHIMNSKVGLDCVMTYGKQLSRYMKIYTCAYCDDYNEDNIPTGYSRSHLPAVYNYLDAIHSDNTVFPTQLCEQNGYAREKFCVVRFPIDSQSTSGARTTSSTRHRVLWAGRFSRQKKIDLLSRIVFNMPDVMFDVYGYAYDKSELDTISLLENLPNVTIHGHFDDFANIVQEDHACLLYTSAWDGMPNILLEAASMHLPIVASLTGGISDLISTRTGYPIGSDSGHEHYCTAIRTIIRDPEGAKLRADAAYSYIKHNHSFTNFSDSLMKMYGAE